MKRREFLEQARSAGLGLAFCRCSSGTGSLGPSGPDAGADDADPGSLENGEGVPVTELLDSGWPFARDEAGLDPAEPAFDDADWDDVMLCRTPHGSRRWCWVVRRAIPTNGSGTAGIGVA